MRRPSRWLAHHGLDERERMDVVLACSEAASNVVEHANGPVEAAFEVDCQCADDELRISIKDRGMAILGDPGAGTRPQHHAPGRGRRRDPPGAPRYDADARQTGQEPMLNSLQMEQRGALTVATMPADVDLASSAATGERLATLRADLESAIDELA
jgi:hypothetical protein